MAEVSTATQSRFVTSDPELAHALITDAYSENRLRLHGRVENFRFEQSRRDYGRIRFDTFYNTLSTDYHVGPLGNVLICRDLDRFIEVEVGNVNRQFSRGDVFLVAPPDREYHARVHAARMELTSLDLSLLNDVAGEERSAHHLQLRTDPLTPSQARRWQRAVDYVADALTDADVAGSPLVLSSLQRVLAATLLSVFDVGRDPAVGPAGSDGTPTALRRAVAFIEANPDLDLGVADIARAAHIGVRGVQGLFRRHLNVTPMAYLRRVRLDRAHRDLCNADSTCGASVSAIAARWGFLSASRFSSAYRATYGCTPRHTLHS